MLYKYKLRKHKYNIQITFIIRFVVYNFGTIEALNYM